MRASVWESVCAPFCTVIGGPVTVWSFDLGQVWHSDGWAPGHTQALSHWDPHTRTLIHTHTNFSSVHLFPLHCWLSQILSWYTNTIVLSSCTWLQIPFILLIQLPHHIQLAKMSVSPLALWPHLPCLEKQQSPNRFVVGNLTWLRGFQIYCWCFSFSCSFQPPVFLSLLMLFVFSLQMRAGILVKKNKQNRVICVSENEVKKYKRPEVKSIISWPVVAYQIMSSHWWVMSRVFHSSFSGLKIHHDCWNHPIGNIPSLLQRILINAKWLALWVSCVIVYYPLLNSVCCLQNKGANVSTP